MADGGSVQQTAAVSLPMTAGVILAQWLVHPTWPPPNEVLTIIVGVLAPIAHLAGRAIYRRLAAWAGPDDAIPIPVPAAHADPLASPAAPISPPTTVTP